MIPIGERCGECGKTHIIKSMEDYLKLSPRIRAQSYRSEHRVFRDKYFLSININDEIWEIYLPLSTLRIERIQEEEEEDHEKESKEEQYLRTIYEDDEEDI